MAAQKGLVKKKEAVKSSQESPSQPQRDLSIQSKDNRPEAIQLQQLQESADSGILNGEIAQLQATADISSNTTAPFQFKENNTGLPDNLKLGMENLSGMSLDHVKVHRNSDKPAAVQAHAYAQGSDIHLASGQEKHLPHELGHVVQQAQGRVKPTTSVNGMAVNDSATLEREADKLGSKAMSNHSTTTQLKAQPSSNISSVVQRVKGPGIVNSKTKMKKDDGGKPMEAKGMFSLSSSTVGPTLNAGETIKEIDYDNQKQGYYQTKLGKETTWIEISKVTNRALGIQEMYKVENPEDTMGGDSDLGLGGTSDLVGEISGGIENTWLKGIDGKGGIQSNLLKGTESTKKDISGYGDLNTKYTEEHSGVATAKDSLDFVSGSLGTLSSIWAMKTAAFEFHKNPNWKSFADGAEGLSAGIANASTAVDGMAKALGAEKGTNPDGVGSDIVVKYTGAVNDGISSLKNAVKGLMDLFKLYNSPSNNKGKDALVSTMQLTKAASGAAKVAKSAYDIIGKGIPEPLIKTIPGLSIAVSAINLIIRFYDSLQANGSIKDMGEKSEKLRKIVAKKLHGAQEYVGEDVFRVERRGVFPTYRNYYRTQPEILPAIDQAYEKGKQAKTNLNLDSTDENNKMKDKFAELEACITRMENTQITKDSNITKTELAESEMSTKDKQIKEVRKLEEKTFELLKSNNGLITDEYLSLHSQWQQSLTNLPELQNEYEQLNEKHQRLLNDQIRLNNEHNTAETNKSNKQAEYNSLPDEIVKMATHKSIRNSSIKKEIPKQQLINQVTDKDSLEELNKTSNITREYGVVDKMAEINQKRKTVGYSDIGKELINMAADIANLSGVGAIVGSVMKGIVAGESLAHSGAKSIQGYYRDKDEGTGDGYSKSGGVDKSSGQKHREYVQHTQHIFRMLNNVPEGDNEQLSYVESVVKATGVNTGMLYALNGMPSKQAEMMVEAMKKRN